MKFNIDHLRDIGWTHWDPIGLRSPGSDWTAMRWKNEYDSYLIRAARLCLVGKTVGEVAAYLIGAATYRIGPGGGRYITVSSIATAREIKRYVQDYLDGRPSGLAGGRPSSDASASS